MDEWKKYIQENNVVVEILIVSRYKVTWPIILELHHDQWNARHVANALWLR